MRYAIISAGKVVNVIEADQEFATSVGAIECGPDVSIGYNYAGGIFTLPTPPVAPPVDLPALKAKLVANIDNVIAAITGKFTRFQMEYERREAAARAFKDAAYVGDPGIWVTGFAQAAGLNYTVAANLIITQADQLRPALEYFGALRMEKYNVLATSNEVDAKTVHDSIIAQAMAKAATLS